MLCLQEGTSRPFYPRMGQMHGGKVLMYLRTEKRGKAKVEIYLHRDCKKCHIEIINKNPITAIRWTHPECKVHNG